MLNIWTKTKHKTHQDHKKPYKAAKVWGDNLAQPSPWGPLNSRCILIQLCLPESSDGDHQAHSFLLGIPLAMSWLYLLEAGKIGYDILGGNNYKSRPHIWGAEKGVFISSSCPERLPLAQTHTPMWSGHSGRYWAYKLTDCGRLTESCLYSSNSESWHGQLDVCTANTPLYIEVSSATHHQAYFT